MKILKNYTKYIFLSLEIFTSLIFGLIIKHTFYFPSRNNVPVFYPFSLIAQSSIPRTIFIVIFIVIFIAFMCLAFACGLNRFVLFIFSLVGLIIILTGMVGMLISPKIEQVDNAYFNNKTYHLIYIFGGQNWGYSSPVEAYTILECDKLGLMCHYFSTPYLTNVINEVFDRSGKFIYKNNRPYLQVGSVVYEMTTDKIISSREKR